MISSIKRISTPNELSEAIDLSKEENTLFYAGGTDIVPNLKNGVRQADHLVLLQNIDALKTISMDAQGGFHLGAMLTLDQIDHDPVINEHFPELSYAAARVASPQIRNLGTIAGNLMQDRRCIYFNQSENWRESIADCFKLGGSVCHQAPASKTCRAPYYSDLATVLVCLEALATVYVSGEKLQIQVSELCKRHAELNGFSQFEKTLIESIYIPPRKGFGFFSKESTRHAIDFPIFNAAISLAGLDDEEQISKNTKVRLVVGAVDQKPLLLREFSQKLLTVLKGDEDYSLDELTSSAVTEIEANAVLVLEDNITPAIKKKTYTSVQKVIEALLFRTGRDNNLTP